MPSVGQNDHRQRTHIEFIPESKSQYYKTTAIKTPCYSESTLSSCVSARIARSQVSLRLRLPLLIFAASLLLIMRCVNQKLEVWER